jgi:hypothetical protein
MKSQAVTKLTFFFSFELYLKYFYAVGASKQLIEGFSEYSNLSAGE